MDKKRPNRKDFRKDRFGSPDIKEEHYIGQIYTGLEAHWKVEESRGQGPGHTPPSPKPCPRVCFKQTRDIHI